MIQSSYRPLKKLSVFFLSETGKIAFILFFTIGMQLLAPSFLLKRLSLSLDSLFTGFLAFIGFIFASRTFITFKLHEVVYSQRPYQELVEKLKKDNSYPQELYEPLKKLDHELSVTTMMAFMSMALIIVISFLDTPTILSKVNIHEITITFADYNWQELSQNKFSISEITFSFLYKIFSDFTCAVIITTFIQLFTNLRSMNNNIKAIIETWEADYNNNKK